MKKVLLWGLMGVIVLSLGGWVFVKSSVTSKTVQKKIITVMTPPITSTNPINRFDFEKETGTELKNKGNRNEQLIALDQIAEDMIKGQNNAKPEFSSFKYLIQDLNRDKNKETNYDIDISGSYIYAKYFMKVEPKEKVNEQKLLDQATLVIKSNHASKDVANLKALIEKLNMIYN